MQRRYEVADDCGGDSRRLWEPAQKGTLRPSGYVYKAVDLWDYFSFDLSDRVEYGIVPLYLLLVGPFIRLGDSEVNGHYYTLVRPSPRTQSRPSGQWTLGIDNAV